MKFSSKRIISLILILTALAIAYFIISQIDLPLETLKRFIQLHHILGPVVFILYNIITVVVAPMSAAPVLPLAAYVWTIGEIAIYFFISWNISAWIAFYISRKYGRRVVSKFVNLDKVDGLMNKYLLNKKTTWLRLLASRLLTPFDIASYAYGLIKMRFIDFVWITLVRSAFSSIFYAWAPKQLIKIFDPVLLIFIIVGVMIIAAFFWPKIKKN